MKIAENILFTLAKHLYMRKQDTAVGNKKPIKNLDDYGQLRYSNVSRVLETASRHNIDITNKTVVDLGCKDGALSIGYLNEGAKNVTGIDIDKPMISRANELYANANLNFIHNTPKEIPLPDNYADLVVSFDVFEHISNLNSILKELHRITKPGGKILIGTWGWHHPYAPHLRSTMPVPWAHVFFGEKTMLRTCRRVYLSDWYKPTLSDIDNNGEKKTDKYTNESISKDYLNKYFIKDFEKDFENSEFSYVTDLAPFSAKIANQTKFLLKLPIFREFFTGYAWFILTK